MLVVEFPTKFSKGGGGGLGRISIFRKALQGKRGRPFSWGGGVVVAVFRKNKLKSEIFNKKKG